MAHGVDTVKLLMFLCLFCGPQSRQYLFMGLFWDCVGNKSCKIIKINIIFWNREF